MATTAAAPTAETVRERLRPMLAGRPVVLTGGPLVSATRTVGLLAELSGRRPFVLAFGVGTGTPPEAEAAVVHVLPAEGADLMASVRATTARLGDLPGDALAALDAYDPHREAVVLAGSFCTQREVAGRTVLDGRLPEWEALEDKVTVDALWDDVGVRRSPVRVVPATYGELAAAAAALDAGAGTVWSGDAHEGFNGGAEYVRWVRSETDARAAHEFFAAHCDRVRVMPFLEGIPCSVHGFVLPDGVAALRPVEMVVLRSAGPPPAFVYAGISTYWDPPDPDREEMREVARRVAVRLRDGHGYRGGFGVDGVLTAEGFLPTELNSRFSGGLGAIGKGLPDLPLDLVQAALVSGHDPGLTATEFEELLVTAADQHRWGGGGRVVTTVRMTETDSRPVVIADGTVRLARGGEQPDGDLMLGPHAAGGYLAFQPLPHRLPVGRSIAPELASALALADQLWNIGLGATEVARPVGAPH